MIRRVSFLNGLAILGVVLTHSAAWGQIAMILWTDRYRPVTVPNFDQVGSLPYYVLLVIRQLAAFAVPAFLFASGFFLAYAAQGAGARISWKMIKARLLTLLIPYVIWSVLIFVYDAFLGTKYSPAQYLVYLLTGGAIGPYFYVPLLVQFYLLAPLIVAWAKANWRALLIVAAAVQLGVLSLSYLQILGVRSPGLNLMVHLTSPVWEFGHWAFYLPFGVVCGLHMKQVRDWLTRYKKVLFAAIAILGILAIVEPELIYRLGRGDYRYNPLTVTSCLYSIAFVLGFLALDNLSAGVSKVLDVLARRSYGIYLIHMKGMEVLGKVMYHFAPWFLAHQLVLQEAMLVFGLAIPLLFMAIIARSSVRRSYRYLFG